MGLNLCKDQKRHNQFIIYQDESIDKEDAFTWPETQISIIDDVMNELEHLGNGPETKSSRLPNEMLDNKGLQLSMDQKVSYRPTNLCVEKPVTQSSSFAERVSLDTEKGLQKDNLELPPTRTDDWDDVLEDVLVGSEALRCKMDVPLPNWEDQLPMFPKVPRLKTVKSEIILREIPVTSPELFRRKSAWKWRKSKYNETRNEIERELILLKLRESQRDSFSKDTPSGTESSYMNNICEDDDRMEKGQHASCWNARYNEVRDKNEKELRIRKAQET